MTCPIIVISMPSLLMESKKRNWTKLLLICKFNIVTLYLPNSHRPSFGCQAQRAQITFPQIPFKRKLESSLILNTISPSKSCTPTSNLSSVNLYLNYTPVPLPSTLRSHLRTPWLNARVYIYVSYVEVCRIGYFLRVTAS